MSASLCAGFFLISFFYSLVGFGGGSSYLSLLALLGVNFLLLPKIALLCNLIVVSSGCYHFAKNGHLRWRMLWPFALTSIPFAYLGARINLSKETFFFLLGLALVVAGLRILLSNSLAAEAKTAAGEIPLPLAFGIGAGLGCLSGMVGIGGGIFLSPLLLNLRGGNVKQIAATASAFIFLNSVASLAGQFLKDPGYADVLPYWPLFLAVLVGGQIGSRTAAGPAPAGVVRALTGLFTLIVGGRLLLFH